MELRVEKLVHEDRGELRQVIYRTLAPAREIVERTVNPFRSMLLIAPMNRGKTSWAEAILGETIEWLVEKQGFEENQIAYVYAEAVDVRTVIREIASSLDLNRVYYLFIFADDAAAAAGQHGRRASSKENVEVSQFYIRIRHEVRKRYGYTRAITAIHTTQVYHLLDKTFREASDIDVVKALPKSEADRKAIARLMAPEYVPAVFSLLRRLGRQRLLARNLREFLEAIYTAVVILDGVPYVVRAYSNPDRIAEETTEKKRWLHRVQHLVLEPSQDTEEAEEQQQDNTNRDGYYRAYVRLLQRMLEANMLKPWGNRVKILLPTKEYVMSTDYIPPEILSQLKQRRARKTYPSSSMSPERTCAP